MLFEGQRAGSEQKSALRMVCLQAKQSFGRESDKTLGNTCNANMILTDVFIIAEPAAASSLSNPMASAALTICKHSSGVKTSSTINAPGTPGTTIFEGCLGRYSFGVSVMADGEDP